MEALSTPCYINIARVEAGPTAADRKWKAYRLEVYSGRRTNIPKKGERSPRQTPATPTDLLCGGSTNSSRPKKAKSSAIQRLVPRDVYIARDSTNRSKTTLLSDQHLVPRDIYLYIYMRRQHKRTKLDSVVNRRLLPRDM